MPTISNHDDVIDSRDLIAAIEELETEQSAFIEEYNEAKEESDDSEHAEDSERLCNAINALSSYWGINPEEVADSVAGFLDPVDTFNGDEALHELKKFSEQLEGYGDFEYGESIIRESYFKEYAQELAEDIGAVKDIYTWPANCIDWSEAAEALKADYTEADFDGVSYYMRA